MSEHRLGAHMSTSGGFHRAVERASQVEATALQIFVKSARQWMPKPLDAEESATFRQAISDAGLQPWLMAHASYLINFAAADDGLWRKSIRALGVEMERCDALGVPLLVFHPGSHVGTGEEAGLARIVEGLDRLLDPDDDKAPLRRDVTVLLENTAGQGTNLGYRFEQLGWILSRVRYPERLGVCFDTCHALAAGYELRTPQGYAETFDAFDQQIGLAQLRAFHLNDSKHPLGSRKDRHEHIGEGEVGLDGFRLLMQDARFRSVPMVLETPKGDGLDEDRRNLATLRRLALRTKK